MKIAEIFRSLGHFSANNPFLVIMFGLTLTVICSLGLMNITLQTDPQELWTNPDGRTWSEQTYFADKFGPYYRVNQMILRLQDPSDFEDLFDYKYLAQIYYLQSMMESATVQMNDQNFSLTDLCFVAVPGKGCVTESPMEYWLMNLTTLLNDTDIKQTATCVTSITSSIACMGRDNVPVQQKVVLGNITCANPNSNSSCNPCEPIASALIVTFLLNNDDFTNEIAMQWEQEVFEQTINNFNAGMYNFSNVSSEMATLFSTAKPTYITYMAQRSIADELVSETTSNAFVVGLSYSLMLVYIAVAIGSFPNSVHSGFLLGVGGILIVISSVLSAVGLCSYFGIEISLISAEVVPFLILAIGVDNMFIISNSYKRLNHERNIQKRLGEALAEAGPSITAAAVCEILAFAVGITTNVPALRGFCLIATLAVFFDFVFQLTVFVGILALDERRKLEKRYDLLFCFYNSDPTPPREEFVKKLVDKYLIPTVFSTPCKIISAIIFFSLIAMSIFGYNQLTLGLEQEVTVTEGSILYQYFQDEATYFETGPEAFIVLKNVNYTDDNDLQVLRNVADALAQLNSSVVPPIYSWVENFNVSKTKLGAPCYAETFNQLPFNEALKSYLAIPIEGDCCQTQGVCGQQYAQDMAFDQFGNLEASRLRFFHTPLVTQANFIDAFLKCRAVVDNYTTYFTNPNVSSAFTYSLFYVYFEQYTFIKAVALEDSLIASGVVFGAIVILRNLSSAIFVYICVVCTAFDMIGAAWLMNEIFGGYEIQINAVSVINIIFAIGLSVEFSVHIMLKYSRTKGSREERAITALSQMGSSVLVGITTTKILGVTILAFAPSTLFRLYYFRMYISMVLIGSFHGLVVLPIMLSLFGPHTPERKRSSTVDPIVFTVKEKAR